METFTDLLKEVLAHSKCISNTQEPSSHVENPTQVARNAKNPNFLVVGFNLSTSSSLSTTQATTSATNITSCQATHWRNCTNTQCEHYRGGKFHGGFCKRILHPMNHGLTSNLTYPDTSSHKDFYHWSIPEDIIDSRINESIFFPRPSHSWF
jgi:hypothetical protein